MLRPASRARRARPTAERRTPERAGRLAVRPRRAGCLRGMACGEARRVSRDGRRPGGAGPRSARAHAGGARGDRRADRALQHGRLRGPGGDADKDMPRALARQFGLARLDANWLADDDGISSVTVRGAAGGGDYIPYTDRPIRWHTDGYYNPPPGGSGRWSCTASRRRATAGKTRCSTTRSRTSRCATPIRRWCARWRRTMR